MDQRAANFYFFIFIFYFGLVMEAYRAIVARYIYISASISSPSACYSNAYAASLPLSLYTDKDKERRISRSAALSIVYKATNNNNNKKKKDKSRAREREREWGALQNVQISLYTSTRGACGRGSSMRVAERVIRLIFIPRFSSIRYGGAVSHRSCWRMGKRKGESATGYNSVPQMLSKQIFSFHFDFDAISRTKEQKEQ